VYRPGTGGNRQAGAQTFTECFQFRYRRLRIEGNRNGRTGDAKKERRPYRIVGHEQCHPILWADSKGAQLSRN
jgi:hypothetical protein